MIKYFQAPWGAKDLLIIFFSTIFLALIAYFSLIFLDPAVLEEDSNKSRILLIGFLIQWIIILGPLILLTSRKYKLKYGNFGINKVKTWTIIKEVLKAYLLFLGISFLIGVLILYFDLKIPGYQIQENIIPQFGNSTWDLIVASIVVILMAPVLEEIFFRGFLLRTLTDKVGIFFGSILSAAVFAIVHFPWQSIIPIFILGLIINSIVIRTKSIIPSIVFHVFNNGIVFTIELLIIKDVISIEKLA